jgi:hypothetical protein
MKRMSDEEVRHGTYSGAMWHNNHKVPKCDPCRRAAADYIKARRANADSGQQRRDAAMQLAERRAKARLMHEYTEKYRSYYEQELAAIYTEWQTPTQGAA